MRDDKQTSSIRDAAHVDDAGHDSVATLLHIAGPSAEISPDIKKRVYANVRTRWGASARGKRKLRWAVPAALAASLLIAITISNQDTVAPARAAGTVVLSDGGQEGALPLVGDTVFVGDVIDTASSGGISIRLKGDLSLRVDSGTILAVESADRINLMAGRIYIDSGDRIYADRHITINTATGTATDIGTQFSVQFEDADMRVAVREGQVDLSDAHQTYSAVQGEAMTIRPGRAVQIDGVSVTGPAWEWAIALAPEFVLENRSLLDFLKWVSRETGMELIFESNDIRIEAMSPHLHGSVEGLKPLEAIEAVLATSRFDYTIVDNTILIRK